MSRCLDYFDNLKIRSKLLVGYGLIILFLVAFALAAAIWVKRIDDGSKTVLHEITPKVGVLRDLKFSGMQLMEAVKTVSWAEGTAPVAAGTAVFESDKVADTIDYEQVALRIRALAASGHFRLVETFADRIAALLMNDFGAPWVKVSAAKLGILPNTKFVGVTIERRR